MYNISIFVLEKNFSQKIITSIMYSVDIWIYIYNVYISQKDRDRKK